MRRSRDDISHPGWLRPAAIPLVLVCGAPASGKSHYVAKHHGANDLVIDLDEIACDLDHPIGVDGWPTIGSRVGGASHSWDRKRLLVPALQRRNDLLHAIGDRSCGWLGAWLIISEPSAGWRRWWHLTLKPQRILVLATPAAECIARIARDADRPQGLEAINQWFAAYQPYDGDELIPGR